MSDDLEKIPELEEWTDEQLEDLQLFYYRGVPDHSGAPLGSVMDPSKVQDYHGPDQK